MNKNCPLCTNLLNLYFIIQNNQLFIIPQVNKKKKKMIAYIILSKILYV